MLICPHLLFMHFIRAIHVRQIYLSIYDTLFEARGCDIAYYANDRTSYRSRPFLCRLKKTMKIKYYWSIQVVFKKLVPQSLTFLLWKWHIDVPANLRNRRTMKFPCVSYYVTGYILFTGIHHIILIWIYQNYEKEKKYWETYTIGKCKNLEKKSKTLRKYQ